MEKAKWCCRVVGGQRHFFFYLGHKVVSECLLSPVWWSVMVEERQQKQKNRKKKQTLSNRSLWLDERDKSWAIWSPQMGKLHLKFNVTLQQLCFWSDFTIMAKRDLTKARCNNAAKKSGRANVWVQSGWITKQVEFKKKKKLRQHQFVMSTYVFLCSKKNSLVFSTFFFKVKTPQQTRQRKPEPFFIFSVI